MGLLCKFTFSMHCVASSKSDLILVQCLSGSIASRNMIKSFQFIEKLIASKKRKTF